MYIGELKKEARERFALNRYHAMLVYGVVYTLALNICVLTTTLCLLNKWAVWYGVILIFLFLLMLAPFGFGMTGFYIRMYRFEKMDAFHIFDGFNKYNLERVIVLRLLKFALGLAFTILLIVPGIIFSIRTSMATYILRANPKLKPYDAIRESNKIMKGHCGKYFGLTLSFIGWFFMGLVTCGLGYIWVMPYFNSTKMVFYKREIEGDTKVYRNPAEAAKPDDDAQGDDEEDEQEELMRRKLLEELRSMDDKIAANNESVSQKNKTETKAPKAAKKAPVEPQAPVQPEPVPEIVFDDVDVSAYAEPIIEPRPITEDTPVADEFSFAERIPYEEDAPIAEDIPIAETAPIVEDIPIAETVPVIEEYDEPIVQPVEERRRPPVQSSRSGEEMRRATAEPLPGGRVVIDSQGRRSVSPRLSASAEPSSRPRARGERGSEESPRERLERIRAERPFGRESRSASQAMDRRTPRKSAEIKEDDDR